MYRIYDLSNYLKTKKDYCDFKRILNPNGINKNQINRVLPKLGRRFHKVNDIVLNEYDLDTDMFLTGIIDRDILEENLME